MKTLLNVLLVTMVILSASHVYAATYYVDYVGGNDGNTGLLPTTAWQHAPGDVNARNSPSGIKLQPGDTVLFKGGVAYWGTINIKESGAQGNPITYDGNSAGTWGNGKAIIDGQGDTLGIHARPYGFLAQDTWNGNPSNGNSIARAHIVINNFEITNLQHIGAVANGGIIFYAGTSTLGTDIEIKNCYLHNLKKKAVAIAIQKGNISVTGTTLTDDGQDYTRYAGISGSLATHSVTIGWAGPLGDYNNADAYIGPLNGGANSITVYKDIALTQPGWNSSFDPTGQTGYFYWLYNLQQGSVMGSGGVGIRVAGYSQVLIHDNVVKEAFQGIAYLSGDGTAIPTNVAIYNNDISSVNWGINPVSGGSKDLDGLSIFNNTIHDYSDYLRAGVYWGWHHDGMFLFNSGGTTGTIRNVKIHDNFFYGDIGLATALVYLYGVISNVQIYNNVFAASSGGGYQIRTEGNLNNIAIYNNDLFHIPGEAKRLSIFSGAKNVVMKNNIYYYLNGYGATYNFDAPVSDGFFSDNNLLPGFSGNTEKQIIVGGTYTTQQWVNADLSFPHDQNSLLFQDPLFKSVPHHAFQVLWEGTPTRAYFIPTVDSHYDYSFKTNDHIEYSYDHIVRQVVSQGTQAVQIGTLARDYLTTQNYLYLTNITSYLALLPKGSAFNIKIDDEILSSDGIDVTANSVFVNQWSHRGLEGTLRADHSAGAAVYAIVSYIDFSPAISGNIISNNTQRGVSIVDWKGISSFVYDLSLQKDSPVIGKGANLSLEIGGLDKNGNPRPSIGPWDIGAYQFQANLPGDVSADGHVTMYDAALVLKYTFGGTLTSTQQAQADINGDSKIDAADALAIAKKALGIN